VTEPQTTRPLLRLPSESFHVPADSGTGGMFRPFGRGDAGGRTATLETLYDFFMDNVPDPDEALAKDPGFLDKLHTHPDVVAAMRKRELTVASMPDRIEANPEAPDPHVADEVAKYVALVWSEVPNIPMLYQQMQAAVLLGGAGHEWTWHREANGVERPVKFDAVHKSRFLFDRLGNLYLKTREFPSYGMMVTAQNPLRRFPMGKFQYHVYRQEPGPWEQPQLEGYLYYGKGEDVALYLPVTFDAFVLRFRMKFLEKYGMPPTVLYHPDNVDAYRGEILRIADSLRGESIIAIPKLMGSNPEADREHYYSVEQLEVPTMGTDMFESFTEGWTKPRIDQILLGSGDENKKGEHGGYSDHVSRQDSGPQVWFRWDAGNISKTINAQVIPAIVLSRFPNLPRCYWPQHRLEPKEERDRAQEMDIATTAATLVPLAEDEIYERSGFRKPKEGEPTVFNGMGAAGGGDPFGLGAGDEDGPPRGAPGNKPKPAAKAKPAGKPREGIGQDGGRGRGANAFNPLTSRER
jgi:hypothetical protein